VVKLLKKQVVWVVIQVRIILIKVLIINIEKRVLSIGKLKD